MSQASAQTTNLLNSSYNADGSGNNTLWILGGVAVLVALALILFTKK